MVFNQFVQVLPSLLFCSAIVWKAMWTARYLLFLYRLPALTPGTGRSTGCGFMPPSLSHLVLTAQRMLTCLSVWHCPGPLTASQSRTSEHSWLTTVSVCPLSAYQEVALECTVNGTNKSQDKKTLGPQCPTASP